MSNVYMKQFGDNVCFDTKTAKMEKKIGQNGGIS